MDACKRCEVCNYIMLHLKMLTSGCCFCSLCSQCYVYQLELSFTAEWLEVEWRRPLWELMARNQMLGPICNWNVVNFACTRWPFNTYAFTFIFSDYRSFLKPSSSCFEISILDPSDMEFFLLKLVQKIVQPWTYWINGLPAIKLDICHHLVRPSFSTSALLLFMYRFLGVIHLARLGCNHVHNCI